MHQAFSKYPLLYLLFSMYGLSLVMAQNADDAEIIKKLLATESQDCTSFLAKAQQANEPVVHYEPKEVMDSFLSYYFAPWDNPFQFFSAQELHKIQQEKVIEHSENPGWGPNRHPLSKEFMATLCGNMDLGNFPNYQQAAITVRAADLRALPCSRPSFGSGAGYPLDNWQELLVAPHTPLYVLHTSQNGAWHFVVADYSYGWIQKEALAYVTPEFRKQWRATNQYITPLHDDVPVAANMYAPLARVGQLMPLAPTQNNEGSYQVLSVAKDPSGYATPQACSVSKTDTVVMPLLATPSNMAGLANSLVGQPYGWRGIEGYRDCSSLLKDLLLPFGIWMPSGSGPQSKAGTFLSLEDLKEAEKETLLKIQGAPFFSLVWCPGHVALYLGSKEGKSYVYHDIWGLGTLTKGQEGHAVIGHVAIMPLEFGKEFSNIPSNLLTKAQGLILFNNRLMNPHGKLALHTK